MDHVRRTLQTPSAGATFGGRRSFADARAHEILTDWKLTPATMMARLDPAWIPAKWLQYLSFKIASCIARGNCGLLISAPPRHGKSLLSTVATPLWALENFPDRNVVLATYGEELSTDFSRQIRDHIQNNQDLLSVRLRSDTQRVTNFLTTKGGGLKAVGLRGAITGRGANILVLDDYIKEPKEAMSAQYLEDLWTWWLTVARTRLEPGAVVIILATRWVTNDIHGRIMARQAETGRGFFEYVELPAIAAPLPDKPDPIGRSPGEVLFPERYNAESIYELKDDLGSRWFNAMFQQRPDKDENAAVDPAWFKKIDRAAFDAQMVTAGWQNQEVAWARAWDFASTKEAGDFTAGALCAYNKVTEEFFIVNMRRGQYSAGKAEYAFTEETEKDFETYANYKVGIEQEPGSSGAYAIRHFRKLLAYSDAKGVAIHEQRATTSKLLNAQPLLAAAEAGKVFVVEDPHTAAGINSTQAWTKAFYLEVESYPEGAHDDQMDAASNAYKLLSGKKGISAAIGRSNAAKAALAQNKAAVGTNLVVPVRSSVTFGRNRR